MGARRVLSLVLVSLCVLVGLLVCGVGSAGAFAGEFGGSGEGAGQFGEPRGVAVDQATGDVYLMDRGNVRIDKFSGEGAFLLAWGWGVADGTQGLQTCTTTCFHGSTPDYGPGTGEFGLGVEGVAVDNDPLSPSYEDVYVPDPGNNRVERFDPSGGFLAMFGREVNEDGTNVCVAGEKCRPGREGAGPGEFDDITGAIAVGPNGDVYVGGSERVQVFGPEGSFVEQIAVAGGTHSIAVDGAGDLFVVNQGAPPTLSEYDSSGVLLRTLDGTGEPRSVALDAAGDVFVDDLTLSNPVSEAHHLLEYGPGGEEIASFDPGSRNVDGGEGIAFGESLGSVYVPIEQSVVRVVPAPSVGPQSFGEEFASGVEPLEATLNATVNSENNATTYRFEYGPTSSYGSTAPSPEGSLPASFNDEPVSATITKLTPGTTYHYRIVATDSKGHIATGADATFTTPTAVLIDSEYAVNVASTSATIGGELNPLGAEATYRIEYDTSEYTPGGPSHGTVLSEGSLGSGSGDVPVSAHASDLVPSTLYHYRIVAHDTREGVPYTVEGPGRTFFTQPAKSVFVLPDGRQWEQVSPMDKFGASVEDSSYGAFQASANGSGISYLSRGATEPEPEGNRSGEPVQLLSVRGAGGWGTRDIDTPNETVGGATVGHGGYYRLFSSDLSLGMVEPLTHSPLPPLPKDAEKTIYLHDLLNGGYEPLVTAGNVVPEAKFGGHGKENKEGTIKFLGATPDLSHVIFQSPVALTPDAFEHIEQGEYNSLYEWFAGKLALVSVLPNNEPASKKETSFLGYRDEVVRHAISDDGSRVVWQSGSPDRLYLRDMVRKEAVQVDAPQGVTGADSEIGGAQFATADRGGSRVFFTSAARLTTDSTVSGTREDLYVFEVTSGSGESLAGRLTDLSVDHNARETADVQGVIGASEDGTSVYFTAHGLLGDAAGHSVAGSTYLYVERYDSVGKVWSAPHLIAALSSADAPTWGNGLGNFQVEMASRVSPDGGFLTFMSSRSLTGYDNHDATSGMPDEEVFLYDADSGRLSCVSCNPTGARPDGVFDHFLDTSVSPLLLVDRRQLWDEKWLAASIPTWVTLGTKNSWYQSRYLSDSGRLFFNSLDALVPYDTNGTWDVYEFEPQGVGGCTSGSVSFRVVSGGCVGLISSGGSRSESAFLDASETGDDVFFVTAASLVSQDSDNLFDVYDAHVCSVAVPCLPVAPVSPPPCSTGDSCKAAPTPQPASFGAPSSQTFSGAGNAPLSSAGGVRSRSLTRAQKLSRALRECRKQPKHKRAECRRQARRRYGRVARARRSRINLSLPVRAGR